MSLAPGNCALNFYSGHPFFVGLQGNDFHVVFAGGRSPMSKYIASDAVLDKNVGGCHSFLRAMYGRQIQ